jgi:hypothetical protein
MEGNMKTVLRHAATPQRRYNIFNLEEKRRLVDQLLARANSFLTGQVGPIETVRSLASFQGVDKQLDEILVTFIALDNETDALPWEEFYRLWNAEVLRRQDMEIAKAELWRHEMVSGACRDLVTNLAPIVEDLRDQHPPPESVEFESVRKKIAEIAEIARDILDGKRSFIEGSRLIWRLGPEARLGDRDPDLTIFVGIDSETDALPVGEERKYWARDALERLQPEIERAEAWAEQYGRTACQNILRRVGGSVP